MCEDRKFKWQESLQLRTWLVGEDVGKTHVNVDLAFLCLFPRQAAQAVTHSTKKLKGEGS